MNSNHFPQAAAGITQSSSKEITTCSLWRRGQGTSPTLHSRAVVGALLSAAVPSPEVFLPGPFVTIPSSGPAVGSALAAYPRWLVAEFEQEVLYERGLAQVGFGVLPLLSLYFLLSKRLTVCLTWFDLVRATAAHRTLPGPRSSAQPSGTAAARYLRTAPCHCPGSRRRNPCCADCLRTQMCRLHGLGWMP